ncbi:MAG: SPFH domain-containing protein [Alphaproteobacteria bacterium]
MEMLLFCLIVLVLILALSAFTVQQQTSVLIERFGKFSRIAKPGLNFMIPFVEKKRGKVTLRLNQLDVDVETKTQDDVFVRITTSVQYRILPTKIYEAFYTLENVEGQIEAFVFDVVRACVPRIKLDDVFAKKDDIADSVKEELREVMNEFGYDILKALVTDIEPDPKVKAAMNEINESQRLRIAAMERGEAEKILKVKQAEGEAESKILQGRGMAGQRKEIVDGLKHSLVEFQDRIPDVNAQDVMSLILMAQYFDTLKEMGSSGNMNTILIPHSPSSLQEIYNQIRTTIIASNQVPGQQPPSA